MKEFNILIDETLNVIDLEELEAAADLFHYGLENGYYNKKQVVEFNNIYWKTKDRLLAFECAAATKANPLEVLNIVSSAPTNIKNDKTALTNYVNTRIKAIKGSLKGSY